MEIPLADIYILTEGGVSKGFGHIARCFALSQAFDKQGYRCSLIVNGDDSIRRIIGDTSFLCLDWINQAQDFLDKVDKTNAVFIIDSYRVDYKQLEHYSNLCKKIAFLDDHGRMDYPEGLILVPINFLSYLNTPYSLERDMIVGKSYILIREPFWKATSERIIKPEIKRVLIMMGGMDVQDLSLTIIDAAINELKGANFDFVYNRSNINASELENIYDPILKHHSSLNAEEMCVLMKEVDLAIVTAGQAAYELLSLGVPTIQISVAENQIWALHALKDIGYMDDILDAHSSTFLADLKSSVKEVKSQENRRDMRRKGMNEVNGQGAMKLAGDVVKYFNQSI